jgi:hypothetical protein
MTTRATRLFTLRLWQAARADDPAVLEWRGKVQALPGGDAYYFHAWPGLIERLEALLAAGGAETTDSVHSEGGEV